MRKTLVFSLLIALLVSAALPALADVGQGAQAPAIYLWRRGDELVGLVEGLDPGQMAQVRILAVLGQYPPTEIFVSATPGTPFTLEFIPNGTDGARINAQVRGADDRVLAQAFLQPDAEFSDSCLAVAPAGGQPAASLRVHEGESVDLAVFVRARGGGWQDVTASADLRPLGSGARECFSVEGKTLRGIKTAFRSAEEYLRVEYQDVARDIPVQVLKPAPYIPYTESPQDSADVVPTFGFSLVPSSIYLGELAQVVWPRDWKLENISFPVFGNVVKAQKTDPNGVTREKTWFSPEKPGEGYVYARFRLPEGKELVATYRLEVLSSDDTPPVASLTQAPAVSWYAGNPRKIYLGGKVEFRVAAPENTEFRAVYGKILQVKPYKETPEGAKTREFLVTYQAPEKPGYDFIIPLTDGQPVPMKWDVETVDWWEGTVDITVPFWTRTGETRILSGLAQTPLGRIANQKVYLTADRGQVTPEVITDEAGFFRYEYTAPADFTGLVQIRASLTPLQPPKTEGGN